MSSFAVLDLNDGAMLLQSDAMSTRGVLPNLAWLINLGRNGGTWDGFGGILSTVAHNAAGVTGLAVVSDIGPDLPGIVSTGISGQGGLPFIRVQYAYNGDLNLDGRVNIDDYFLIDLGAANAGANTPPNYQSGDIDQNWGIDGDDYFLIDSAFVSQGAPMMAQDAVPASLPIPLPAPLPMPLPAAPEGSGFDLGSAADDLLGDQPAM
jgi:hypothetical protein